MTCLSLAPLLAGQNWAEDFLRKYKPSTSDAPTTVASTTPVVQRLQTGNAAPHDAGRSEPDAGHNLDIQSESLRPPLIISCRAWCSIERCSPRSLRGNHDTGHIRQHFAAERRNLLSQLRHNYAVGFSQALKQGTSVAVDLTMNRSSSNSSNATYNPSYTGNLRYSVGQHLLRDRGPLVNTRQIRMAAKQPKDFGN